MIEKRSIKIRTKAAELFGATEEECNMLFADNGLDDIVTRLWSNDGFPQYLTFNE